jgi:hypothetical protein
MRRFRMALTTAAAMLLLLSAVPDGRAQEADEPPPPDISKLDYAPTPDLADLDNWETYNAYNVVNFVSNNLTNRMPNDQTSDDPLGDPNPECKLRGNYPAGGCTYNHQLEYLAWWEDALQGVLGDFGVTFRSYQFNAPSSGPANFSTNGGRAFNKLAIVPGADDPEDIVIIGSHYDQVAGSPYAAWDQTAGTGVMMRTAKLLADYWNETGTRPSKTYVFAAWDAEESGTNGSKFYVGLKNNRTSPSGTLPKDPEVTVTSYINHDPCGANYPALYRGLPASRQPLAEKTGFIPLNVALHTPRGSADEQARMAAFNASIPTKVNQLFNAIDDTLPVAPGHEGLEVIPVFLSKEEAAELGSEALEQESIVKINEGGSLLFGTDAESFHEWIPTLNPYPDIIGPHAVNANNPKPEDTGWSVDALVWIHTPLDNFEGLVAYTSADQTGLTYSKGLAMSWELCSQLSSWTMLQPDQGGAQVADDSVVAFFETPKPNVNGGTHVFDASGSYTYTDPETREMKTGDQLEYHWDFGDGTFDEGMVVEHSFDIAKGYQVTLTVVDPETEASDQMTLKVGTGPL